MSDQVNPGNVPLCDELAAQKPPTEMQLMWLTSLLEHASADERALILLFGPEFTRISALSGHAVEWGIHQIILFLQEMKYHGEDNPDDLMQPLKPRNYL